MVIIVAMLVAAVDQGIKWLLVHHLVLGESRVLVPHVLDLNYRQNQHAAFSQLPSLTPTMLLIISVVVLVLFALLIRPYLRTRTGIAAAVLVYGGAIRQLSRSLPAALRHRLPRFPCVAGLQFR